LQGEVELRSGGRKLKPSLIWIKAVGIEDGNCEKVTTRMQPSVIVWDLETVPDLGVAIPNVYAEILVAHFAKHSYLRATAWLLEVALNREGIGRRAIDQGNCADRPLSRRPSSVIRTEFSRAVADADDALWCRCREPGVDQLNHHSSRNHGPA
jgi:hypothetical protein